MASFDLIFSGRVVPNVDPNQAAEELCRLIEWDLHNRACGHYWGPTLAGHAGVDGGGGARVVVPGDGPRRGGVFASFAAAATRTALAAASRFTLASP